MAKLVKRTFPIETFFKIIIFEDFLLFSKLGSAHLERIFFSKKWATIYKNPIIFEKLVRSDAKETFYHKKQKICVKKLSEGISIPHFGTMEFYII